MINMKQQERPCMENNFIKKSHGEPWLDFWEKKGN